MPAAAPGAVTPRKLYQYNITMVRDGNVHLDYKRGKPVCVRSPAEAVSVLAAYLKQWDREVFVVMALDTRNKPIGINRASIGSLNASIVHPREAFKFAILANASSIMLAHNHPSGDPGPSQEDIDLTRRLVDAGRVLGIDVLDHIIIGGDKHASLKALNLM